MNYFYRVACFFIAFVGGLAIAGNPVWTFTPLTATTANVYPDSSIVVQYTVTNQSRKSKTLAMTPITGITQQTGAGKCDSPFTLAYQASCTLSLVITGSALTQSVSSGPVVCQEGSLFQCYQPSAANVLRLTKTVNQYSVGGMASGLVGTVVLQNNLADDLSVTGGADANFTFATQLDQGATYSVTVKTPPAGQTCEVQNGSGTIGSANVTNVLVICM